jgi:hypothetical protein
MDLVKQVLETDPAGKPPLFYGRAHTGKTTLITSALRELGYHVISVQRHDMLASTRLQGNTHFGRTAYVVKIDSLGELVDALPGTRVAYCCIDPYSFAKADQLSARFRLVDLSKQLGNVRRLHPGSWLSVGSLDEDSIRKPPWIALKSLTEPATNYASRMAVVEANPQLLGMLYRNIDKGSDAIDDCVAVAEQLSLLDHFPSYIDHSAAHSDTLQCLALVRGLGLGRQQLNWRSDGTSLYGKHKAGRAAAAEHFSALDPEKQSDNKNKLQPAVVEKRKAAAPSATAPTKRQRSAPQCKACGVPLKGHRCPHRAVK